LLSRASPVTLCVHGSHCPLAARALPTAPCGPHVAVGLYTHLFVFPCAPAASGPAAWLVAAKPTVPQVCNHPDLFEPRPIVSPLCGVALVVRVPSLALVAPCATSPLPGEQHWPALARLGALQDYGTLPDLALGSGLLPASVPWLHRARVTFDEMVCGASLDAAMAMRWPGDHVPPAVWAHRGGAAAAAAGGGGVPLAELSGALVAFHAQLHAHRSEWRKVHAPLPPPHPLCPSLCRFPPDCRIVVARVTVVLVLSVLLVLLVLLLLLRSPACAPPPPSMTAGGSGHCCTAAGWWQR
jgi:hypothetical protein